jgi:hypothetical protein
MSQKNYTPACSAAAEKRESFFISRSCFSIRTVNPVLGFLISNLFKYRSNKCNIIVALVYFAFHVNSVSGFKLDPLIEMFDVNLKFPFLFCHSRWVKNALFCSLDGEHLEGERYIFTKLKVYYVPSGVFKSHAILSSLPSNKQIKHKMYLNINKNVFYLDILLYFSAKTDNQNPSQHDLTMSDLAYQVLRLLNSYMNVIL